MSILSAIGPIFPDIGTRTGTSILSPVLNVATTVAAYNVNSKTQVIIPGAGELLDCISRGIFTSAELATELGFHGINANSSAWPGVLASMRVCPSPDAAVQSFHRDRIGPVTASRWIKYHKITGKSETDWLWSKPYIWNAQVCRTLNAIGQIDAAKYEDWLKAAGLLLPEDRAAFKSMVQVPNHNELQEAYRRGIIDYNTYKKWLALLGFTDNDVVNTISQLSLLLPTPSDMVNFAVKEVWNQDVVNAFGYDAEYDQIPEYKYWMEKLGFSGSPDVPGQPAAGMGAWSQAYWRAHWRNIAPTQAYAMLHRLRPTGGPNGGPRVPFVPGTNQPVLPWNIQDVNRVLKVDDYAPAFRDRLAAISYRTLRLYDIRKIVIKSWLDQAFKLQVVGPGVTIADWAKEQHLDRGQTPKDAETLAKLNDTEGANALQRAQMAWTIKPYRKKERRISAQYAIGGITKAFAINELVSIGWSGVAATMWCDEIDQERKVKCAQQNMAVVKAKLMAGKINNIQGYTWLLKVGILPDKAAFWINCWNGLLTSGNVQPAAQAALAEHKQGLITAAQAKEILTNLGYRNADVLVARNEVDALLGA